jgi:hypothetical protein
VIKDDFMVFLQPSTTFIYLMEGPQSADFMYTRDMLSIACNANKPHNVAYLLYVDISTSTKTYPHLNENESIIRVIENGVDCISFLLMLNHEKFRSKISRDKRVIDSFLMTIISYRRTDLLILLVSDPQLGVTPDETVLQSAITADLISAVKYFVEVVKIPLNSTALNLSPLHVSVEHASIEITTYLLDQGSNPIALSANGLTVLLHAARHGNIAALELLTQRGVCLADGGKTMILDETKEEEN